MTLFLDFLFFIIFVVFGFLFLPLNLCMGENTKQNNAQILNYPETEKFKM